MPTSSIHRPHTARTTMLALVLAFSPRAFTQAAPERIGTFDSRAVAYAYFWSETGTKQRNELIAAVRSAQTAGDSARLKRAETAIHDFDGRNHLAVFSTGPADEALAALHDHIPEILAKAGAARLVSKWDTAALASAGDSEQVDVTSLLVAAFKLPPEKLHVIDEILAHEPIPLERAKALLLAGKL